MNQTNPAAQRNILIIGGDAINRLVLRKIFSQDYGVAEAENGRLGLDLLLSRGSGFSAVLLDVNTPGVSGPEVLRALSERGVTEKLPVFLMVPEEGGIAEEAYELGAADVIRKPPAALGALRRVESAIELFEARARLSQTARDQQAAMLEQANRTIRLSQGLIEALVTAMEFRGEEYGGHAARISQISRYVLENTSFGRGIGPEEVDNIALAAVMHDVGKITVPDAILTKSGRLTPEEFEIMKGHTTRGALILDSIPQLRESGVYKYARDIALHHHERWDGGGYPEGLSGDGISPWAQAVSLADVYDALSCKRVYKAGYSREKVLDMIRNGDCGMFNPKLLESFLEVEDHLSLIYQSLPEAENY